MRINNNMMAMNTHRQMGVTAGAQSKSMEKLSSGFRINRAGDDAAGLAISEKMRGQIRGLNQASRNSQDAISLVQTAEGALNETQSILQRMRELAVQSANDTNVDEDRGAIQNEIDQLSKEIDRIGNTTEFNTRKLLNGNAAFNAKVTDGAGAELAKGQGVKVKAGGNLQTGDVVDLTNVKAATKASFKVTASAVGEDIKVGADTALKINGVTVNLKAGTTGTDIVDAINSVSDQTGVVASYKEGSAIKNELILTTEGVGSDAKVEVSGVKMSADGAAADTFTDGGAGTTGLVVATSDGTTDTVVSAADAAMAATVVAKNSGADATATVAGSVVTGKGNEITVHGGDADGLVLDVDKTKTTAGAVKVTVESNNSLSMQIGANKGQDLSVSLSDMRAEALGVDKVDISSSKNAKSAIETIGNAITKVSEERAKLGAVQNRLEHTIANLDTSAENLQASESRIRDVDMAKEMMTFTKNNILQQAAQAMLAQANQAPKGVLQLLR